MTRTLFATSEDRAAAFGAKAAHLESLGVLNAQSAHSFLWRNPALAEREAQRSVGLSLKSTRAEHLEALERDVSKEYLSLVHGHEYWRSRFPLGHGAAVASSSLAALEQATAQSLITRVDASASKKNRLPPQTQIDLVGARRWALRNQNGYSTCVAYAALACMELKSSSSETEEPKRLSARFLYRNSRQVGFASKLHTGIWEAGGVKFEYARDAIHDFGVLEEAECLDFFAAGDVSADRRAFDKAAPKLSSDLQRQAKARAVRPAHYADYMAAPLRAGEALRVFNELENGRAVAVALPGFAKQKSIDKSLWWLPDFWLTGVLPPPLPTQRLGDTGHAVCIVGFLPNKALLKRLPEDRFGGYFAFRNSWGDTLFGAESPVGLQPGYGLLPASMIEYFTLESISF